MFLILPKNERKHINLRYCSNVGGIFSLVFFEEFKTSKSPFEIIRPLVFKKKYRSTKISLASLKSFDFIHLFISIMYMSPLDYFVDGVTN